MSCKALLKEQIQKGYRNTVDNKQYKQKQNKVKENYTLGKVCEVSWNSFHNLVILKQECNICWDVIRRNKFYDDYLKIIEKI